MQSSLSEPTPAFWDQIAPLLEDAMGCLGETERNAVVLRFFVDLDDTEIAEHLDCRPGTVRSLISRALKSLRKEMNR